MSPLAFVLHADRLCPHGVAKPDIFLRDDLGPQTAVKRTEPEGIREGQRRVWEASFHYGEVSNFGVG